MPPARPDGPRRPARTDRPNQGAYQSDIVCSSRAIKSVVETVLCPSMKGSLTIGPLKKLILLGGGQGLIPLIELCQSLGLECSVLTSPRHAEEAFSGGGTLRGYLQKNCVSLLVADSIDTEELQEFVGSMENALALSHGAAWIFTGKIIHDLFQDKLVNEHGRRLPRDRGGGGFSWQILRGDRLGNILLHVLDEGVDTGPILTYEEFVFPATCRTPQDFMDFYEEKSLAFMKIFLSELQSGERTFTLLPQTEYLSSYHPRLHTATHG